MHEESFLAIAQLLTCPTSFKILLAMAEHGQVYQFQLTMLTGAHRATIMTAIKLLTERKLIKVAESQVRIKNAGEFYALTSHGVRVTNHLKVLARSLENIK